ncbi:MAG: abortive infection protein [Clostridiaceae bacterium]|nr:abortive infection protein [Clostridiaceae bacterium]
MNRRGVCYDVGRVLMEKHFRPEFDVNIIKRELEIIKEELHCNVVKICGKDIERLMKASEFALNLGLEVWVSPELWDKNPEDTMEYIVEAAVESEKLRLKHEGKVVFVMGTEISLFMNGILKGNNFMERLQSPDFNEIVTKGKHNTILNKFLENGNTRVRNVFKGPVTYASTPLEAVNWKIFDFVCVDIYRDAKIKEEYPKLLKSFAIHDKPVVIGEFGCCTYEGAEECGGWAWNILDESDNESLDGNYIRNEAVQAYELTEQLNIIENSGADGGFVFTFVQPTFKHAEDPKFDLDMASFSLVKTLHGGNGQTYKDMNWEPKESFYALSEFYGELEYN